jgi:hypothetical protein
MKKLILVVAMSVAGMSAFADDTTAVSGSSSTAITSSTSVAGAAVSKSGNSQSTSGATVSGTSATGGSATGGTVSGVAATGNTSGNVSVGCLVNCADTSQGSKDLADSAVAAAAIAAQAARDVANTTQHAVIKNTPAVLGPNLVSSNDTCMGSTSGSANVPGIGIGFGTSWVDENCKMLKNSREMWNMGMKAAALALMCTDKANKDALELTGFVCPQTERDNKAKAKSAQAETGTPVSSAEITDPIIRARLGLDSQVATK